MLKNIMESIGIDDVTAPGQQDALAGDEKLAQTQARAIQETAILPSGM